jgi:hypothetical protein
VILVGLVSAYVIAPFALGFVTGYAIPKRSRRAVFGAGVALAVGFLTLGWILGESSGEDYGPVGGVIVAALFVLWILAFVNLGVAFGQGWRRRATS